MSKVRDLLSMPLEASLIEKLQSSGFTTVADVIKLRPIELSQELGVPPSKAMEILKQIGNFSRSGDLNVDSSVNSINDTSISKTQQGVFSAKDLVSRMSVQRPIITFCKALDISIGGGIPSGQITEICGVPGIGKTQLAIQLVLNTQIPEIFNGNGGEAIFIDTEGCFIAERAAEMAQELSAHLLKLAALSMRAKTQEIYLAQLNAAENMTKERFLEGIHVFRCHDSTEFLATLQHLPALLVLKRKIKLIVIDSIAFPLRLQEGTAHDSAAQRGRLLASTAQLLNELAYEHKLAVVVTNHVTTKVVRGHGGEAVGGRSFFRRILLMLCFHVLIPISFVPLLESLSRSVAPALGETWAHCVTTRLLLSWQTNGLIDE